MPTVPPRIVTPVVLDAIGRLLGALPPFQAATTPWLDLQPVLDTLRERDGLQATVLRLLHAARDRPNGGDVSVLVQLDAGAVPPSLAPWPGALHPHPLRRPWAVPGGPQADLAWAAGALQSAGRPLAGPPRQQRSWGLSSLWRLPTDGGSAWLKVLPPFFAHEGALLAALQGEPVPGVLAQDGARLLLEEVPGGDLDGGDAQACRAMVDLLVDLQARWLGRARELAALGLPDWRAPALAEALRAHAQRVEGGLDAADRDRLRHFAETLPGRLADVAACGLPDGLVHGDLHPGNLRGTAGGMTLLDWADSGIGHPLLDLPPFLHRVAPTWVPSLRRHWLHRWQRAWPAADVETAERRLAPVAALRLSMLSQGFIDRSEPAEAAYHRRGVQAWLHQALQRLRDEPRA